MLEKTITMAHGSGGEATERLIREVFCRHFHNEYLDSLNDASSVPGAGRLAMTTDSFVVTPYFYPGGDIGRLAVCGTVNDLLVSGAVPKYLSCGFILEEGLPVDDLDRIAASMAATAGEAGVAIVTGDTKVIEGKGGGGLLINTAGIGFLDEGRKVGPDQIKPGDKVIVSGTLGEHHAAILGCRMGMQNDSIFSDNAPLTAMVNALFGAGIPVRAMRDVTRGGLATVLNEFAKSSGLSVTVGEDKLPVLAPVRDFCGILGLDPLYMGNEGKLVAVVAPEAAEQALDIIRRSPFGENAAVIGETGKTYEDAPALYIRTPIGGTRVAGALYGEGLPRIC